MADFRNAILKQLRKKNLTPNRASHEQSAVHPATCRAFLYGDRSTSVKTVESLFDLAGLEVVDAKELALLRKLARRLKTSDRIPHDAREIINQIGKDNGQ